MKIAIITDAIYPFTLGGSEVRNHEIAKRLVKRGHEVHIYGAKLWKGQPIRKLDGVIIHGISNYEKLYANNKKRGVMDPIKLSIKLIYKIKNENFDIIDCASFAFFNCYSMKLITLLKKSKLVLTWHQYFGDYLLGYFGTIKGNIGIMLERMTLNLTNNNIAVSNYMKKELIERGVKEKNIETIYNGADLKLAKSSKKAIKKYDLIFIGRLNYQKNIPLLIDSINIIKKDLPKIKACIIGEGSEKEKLVKMIRDYNIEENIEFIGRVEDKKKVFEYIKSSKIFVLPSLLEGFPLTIIEANACGLPVIITQTKWNNTGEYIKNYHNGFIVKPDAKTFSEKIMGLLKNKKLYKKISKKSINMAKDYDWENITRKIEEYYAKIMND